VAEVPRVCVVATSDFSGFPVGGTLTFLSNIVAFLDLPMVLVGVHSARTLDSELPRLPRSMEWIDLGAIDPASPVPQRIQAAALGVRRLRSALQERADLVYVHSPELGPPALWAAGAPLIYHLHGANFSTTYSPHRLLRSGLGGLSFRMLNDWVVDHSCEVFGVNTLCERYAAGRGKKFVLAPTCVDTSMFAPGVRRRDRRDGIVVGFVGRLDRVKNVSFGLRTLKEVARREPRTSMLVVGGGPELESLKALSTELGVADRVEFLGTVAHSALPALLTEMDLLLLSSHFEGLPTVVLEALACGVPVLSPRLAGLEEAFGDRGGVVFYDDWDPQIAAEKVVQVVDAKSLHGGRGLELVRMKYSATSVMSMVKEELLAVWERHR
jgi:glycosyltransferase involved in cell wall biosynthesis